MRAWMLAYTAAHGVCEANLPLPQNLQGPLLLNEPVLLLGTAGTGKTTTLQAANQLLEAHGLKARIVRCAYTGVAASNMGSGGRTLVSLFRLNKRKFGGGLEPLSFEDLRAMDEELRGMCLLEIDELSMTEKLILTCISACSSGEWSCIMIGIVAVARRCVPPLLVSAVPDYRLVA